VLEELVVFGSVVRKEHRETTDLTVQYQDQTSQPSRPLEAVAEDITMTPEVNSTVSQVVQVVEQDEMAQAEIAQAVRALPTKDSRERTAPATSNQEVVEEPAKQEEPMVKCTVVMVYQVLSLVQRPQGVVAEKDVLVQVQAAVMAVLAEADLVARVARQAVKAMVQPTAQPIQEVVEVVKEIQVTVVMTTKRQVVQVLLF
jgi:predicted nucleotidyltransferase